MFKIAKLRQELAALKKDGQALLAVAQAEDRDLTEDESAAFDALKEKIDAKQAELSAAENMADRVRAMDGVPAAGQNMVHDTNPALTGGFRNVSDFATHVRAALTHGGTMDDRLRQFAAGDHQGGGSSGEGFQLPPQFRDDIWTLVNEFDEFSGVITEEPTTKREVKIPVDESTPWGASGIKAYWRAEGSQMAATDLADEGRNVPLHELYAFTTATEELLEDSPRLANRLTNGAAEAIAWKKNLAYVEGTGVGQPLGWMKSGALIVQAKESGQAAGTVNVQNIVKMYSRLLMNGADNPFWLINSEVLPELMVLQIGDRPIWTPPNGLVDAPGGFLLGRPIRFSEFASELGAQGDVQLIAPRGYYSARRSQSENFATSMHLYFDYNKTAFRWTFRLGGQPFLSAPRSPAKGSLTKSHFVTLAARA